MIVLTLDESDIEYVSGFPEYVNFSTSKPATVFYTLDGSTPDITSLIAVGDVYLPTIGTAITLRAIAISPDDTSVVLEVEYKTDSSDLDRPRYLDGEGIIVIPFDAEIVDSISFDSTGNDAQETAVELTELEIKASTTDARGESIGQQKTSSSFVNFAISTAANAEVSQSSPNNNNVQFDPDANFISVDGSTDANFQNQVVKLVNRTYNAFGPTSKFYEERLGQKEPIVTGNYVRSFYNPTTGLYVSYYWESLESRWLVSTQSISRDTLNIAPKMEHRFVFRWIQDRALSQLF